MTNHDWYVLKNSKVACLKQFMDSKHAKCNWTLSSQTDDAAFTHGAQTGGGAPCSDSHTRVSNRTLKFRYCDNSGSKIILPLYLDAKQLEQVYLIYEICPIRPLTVEVRTGISGI